MLTDGKVLLLPQLDTSFIASLLLRSLNPMITKTKGKVA
jgi:hypothetical protein